jgi:hypothetical protein
VVPDISKHHGAFVFSLGPLAPEREGTTILPNIRSYSRTTKSQKVFIFSKTAVRTPNLTINEHYYCYGLTAKQQFTSITFKQCAGETENLCFYSRHLTFLLSFTCANPQISMTQLKHINLLRCHE